MGHFFAVTAVRAAVPVVVQAVHRYMEAHHVKSGGLHPGCSRTNEKTDALVRSVPSGWTVIGWPAYFNIHDFPCALWLSGELKTLVSTVNVYDGNCWTHGLFEHGRELDRFCSMPELADDDPEQGALNFRGHPDVVGRAFGVEAAVVARYLVHITDETDGKALPDDQFTLDDFWVFTDFWRRLGIIYPDLTEYDEPIRLAKDFGSKLPMNE